MPNGWNVNTIWFQLHKVCYFVNLHTGFPLYNLVKYAFMSGSHVLYNNKCHVCISRYFLKQLLKCGNSISRSTYANNKINLTGSFLLYTHLLEFILCDIKKG